MARTSNNSDSLQADVNAGKANPLHHWFRDKQMVDKSAYDLSRYHSVWRYLLRYLIQGLLLSGLLHLVLRIKVTGRKQLRHLDSSKPLIIMPNHQSQFDAPLVVALLPRRLGSKAAVGAATDNFFRSWLQSKPTRLLVNTYPIDRDNSHRHSGISSKLVAERVPIVVFPEGTRTRTGKLGSFHDGLSRIAIDRNATIIPVAIDGAYLAWPADRRIWRWNRPLVKVSFLKPIKPQAGESPAALTDRIKQAIAVAIS